MRNLVEACLVAFLSVEGLFFFFNRGNKESTSLLYLATTQSLGGGVDREAETYGELVRHKWWKDNVTEKEIEKVVDWLTQCTPDGFTLYQNGALRNLAEEAEHKRKLREQDDEFAKDHNLVALSVFRATRKMEESKEYGFSVTFDVQRRQTRNEIVEKILNAIESASNKGDWIPQSSRGRGRL
jgi:hypothetical protein